MNNFVVDYRNGPACKGHSPNISMKECFCLIADLMEWAGKNNKRVTFAGGWDWEPLPEPDELVIQVSELPDPRKVAFAWPKIHLPVSAGGDWWDFDIWRKNIAWNKIKKGDKAGALRLLLPNQKRCNQVEII